MKIIFNISLIIIFNLTVNICNGQILSNNILKAKEKSFPNITNLSSVFINEKKTSANSKSDFKNRTMLFAVVNRIGSTNKSTPDIGYNQAYGTGVGVHILYIFNSNFAISAEPMLQPRGYKINTTKTTITYLDVPINIKRVKDLPFFTANDILYIGVGVYAGYAISGKKVNTYNNTNQTISFGNSKTDERTRFDFGLNFNVGMYIGSFAALGFGFQTGLINVLPKDLQINGNETKLSSLSVSFGLNTAIFKKKK